MDERIKKCSTCKQEKPISEFPKNKQKPDGYSYSCRACVWAAEKARREANPERVQKLKESYERNYEKYKETRRTKWETDPEYRERELQRGREYYDQNKEKVYEKNRRYAKENREYLNDKQRAWRLAHPEQSKEYDLKHTANRREQLENARKLGTHTDREWITLCVRNNFKCLCCGRDDVNLTKDHIIPMSDGGSDSIDNIQPLCASCNTKKGRDWTDYRQR